VDQLEDSTAVRLKHWAIITVSVAVFFFTVVLPVSGAGATSLSAVTLTGTAPTSLVENTASTWTVGFTTSPSGALASGSSITVTFPSGFTTSSAAPAISLETPTGTGLFATDCKGTGVDANELNVVTINLTTKAGTCTLAASTAATLTVAVINGAAGTYGASNFSVATSTDTTAVAPSAGETITAGTTSVSAFTIASTAPTSLIEEAASTWTIGFTASSSGALVTGSTITVTFPSGFTTFSTTPTVTLTSAADNFDTYCTASALDATESNVIVVTLANASGDTCWLKDSAAAKFTIGVVNGTADALTNFLLSTSSDMTAVTTTTAAAPALTAAASPSAVSFTSTAPTSLVAGSASTWTVNFTASATGVLKTGGYIVVTFPIGFTTASTTPAVTLTSTVDHFDTYCTASATDLLETNVVVITLSDAAGETCKLDDSAAASFTVGVINGLAGTYGDTTYSLFTSMDGISAQPTSGSETLVAPSSSGTNWTVASSTSSGEASSESAPASPASLFGGATGGYMCDPSGNEEVDLAWTPVTGATSYVILQSSSPSGTYSVASPAPVYFGATATISYTGAATEYYEVEAYIGTSWVSVPSGAASNGSISPGFAVLANSAPKCTNN
jgi:hypothetical protein